MDDFIWWRDGVIYQIYPRSFSDSNGDGLGDLPGVIARLDYLADLGVDAVWLSPFYPSPDKDFGYDVSNYVDVDPRFGTLADFDRLVAEAHARGIRVILDLVLNHTSDRHPWFLESMSSRDNPKADWYIWRPPSGSPHFLRKWGERQRGVPNNWQAALGEPAWGWVEERGQFYHFSFLREEPDVNWRNPEVHAALMDVVRFWLERGADGFRLDIFNVFFKDAQFRDNPPTFGLRAYDRQKHIYDMDQPEMFPLLQEFRTLLDTYEDRYSVGEPLFAPPEMTARYCGPDKLHAAFNFDFTICRFDPRQFLRAILNWERAAGTEVWPNYVLGNHDIIRPATRFGEGFLGAERMFIAQLPSGRLEDDSRAKVLMALLLTLRGTPFIYNGDEIGMRELFLTHKEIMDPQGKIYWPLVRGRDGCRTPMQWDASANAGFSTARPWVRIHPDYRTRNVEAQRADPDSLLNLTRALISLRKEKRALRRGRFVPVTPQPRGALVYRRELQGEKPILVALNFSRRALRLETPGRWNTLFGPAPAEVRERCELGAYEAMLFESL
ncbi:MAG: alpha-amylase family glycosyl hydrolase [Chloroflexota bacterium]